jgi:hypothetical protein
MRPEINLRPFLLPARSPQETLCVRKAGWTAAISLEGADFIGGVFDNPPAPSSCDDGADRAFFAHQKEGFRLLRDCALSRLSSTLPGTLLAARQCLIFQRVSDGARRISAQLRDAVHRAFSQATPAYRATGNFPTAATLVAAHNSYITATHGNGRQDVGHNASTQGCFQQGCWQVMNRARSRALCPSPFRPLLSLNALVTFADYHAHFF